MKTRSLIHLALIVGSLLCWGCDSTPASLDGSAPDLGAPGGDGPGLVDGGRDGQGGSDDARVGDGGSADGAAALECGPGKLALARTIDNPTPDVDDRFGSAGGGFERPVAISAGYLLVGAVKDDTAGEDAGAAYLFEVSTGKLLHTFVSPKPGSMQGFGMAVALSGKLALVSEPGASVTVDGAAIDGAGAAYLFDVSTGTLVRTLSKPGAARNDRVGNAVALQGNLAAVAAWIDDTAAEGAGAVFLFDASTGDLLRTIVAPGASAGDQFGVAVALAGDRVLVGSRSGDTTTVADAGLAFLFDTNTGALLQTFTHPEPTEKDQFGYAVALEGDTVVVSSPTDDPEAASTGTALVFDAKTGKLLETLSAPAKETGDVFGTAVSIAGDRILVGSVRDDNGTGAVGTAYVFHTKTFALTQELQNPTPADNDIFGSPVVLWGNQAVVAAGRDDTGADNAGAVYVYCGAL